MSDIVLVDSHCHLDHLDLTPFQGDLNKALQAAYEAQVKYFLNVCIHPNTFDTLLSMAKNRSDMAVSIGLHPTESIEQEPTVEQLTAWAAHPRVAAIGETGLDYCRSDTDRALQQHRFRNHIQAAKQVNKPLIIHTRSAVEDTLSILKEENAQAVGGVLHCFTESLEMAQYAIAELNFYVSFSGILTFKNAESLRDIARQLPLDRLLIETDSPYLTPMPFRGKSPNQPAYVSYVAHTLAQIHDVSFEEVAKKTTHNFFELFRHAGKVN
jgi:TatD DNase family protein